MRQNQREQLTQHDSLWTDAEDIRGMLEYADDLEEAREGVFEILHELETDVLSDDLAEDRLEWRARIEAIRVLKDFLAAENEALTGFSTLQILWDLARGVERPYIEDGFVTEFVHLFRAMQGKSGVGHGWMPDDPKLGSHDFDELPQTGKHACVRRSRFLDEVGLRVNEKLNRFTCGLDQDVWTAREKNRAAILAHFGASEDEWFNWQWQVAHVLKGSEGLRTLETLVALSSEEASAVSKAVQTGIPWGITPYYLSLFDFASSSRARDGQVRSQVIPPLHLVKSMVAHCDDRSTALDFMGEHHTSPADRITRRYPHVAILKVCGVCPQICSYCQRNWEIDDAMMLDNMPDKAALGSALDWFAAHPAVHDVLVTGGDPLILPEDVLFHVLDRLSRLDHVRHIRIGTRVPVTMPMRITDTFANRLSSYIKPGVRNLSLVTHVESGYEVTPELANCVARLKRGGISVFNQQVFTLETSRRFQTVATRIALNQIGITPYYLFYTKGKSEHRDYLVPIARILQERKEEARLLPGIMRTDEPVFNVPRLGKHNLRARQDREWIGVRPDGTRIYLFHPWEKGIAPVEPWIYDDVSISDYLQRLQALGEDPTEYDSIWNYY